jgi:hypothetical protein
MSDKVKILGGLYRRPYGKWAEDEEILEDECERKRKAAKEK